MITATIQIPDNVIKKIWKNLTYEKLKRYINKENSKKLERWKQIDNKLKNLKVVKEDSANELKKSLDFLNKQFKNSWYKSFSLAKQDYLFKKYN